MVDSYIQLILIEGLLFSALGSGVIEIKKMFCHLKECTF